MLNVFDPIERSLFKVRVPLTVKSWDDVSEDPTVRLLNVKLPPPEIVLPFIVMVPLEALNVEPAPALKFPLTTKLLAVVTLAELAIDKPLN